MLRAIFFAALLGSACVSAAWADVYKYTDANGKVIYSDKPMQNSERLHIRTRQKDSEETEKRLDEESKNLAKSDKALTDATAAGADKKKGAEISASGKAEACNKARQTYVDRMNARRVYEEQAGGERRLLDDKEIDAARAQAKQAMDALCN